MKRHMTLIYLLIGIAVLAYLGLPLMIKSTLRINARPTMTPATPKFLGDDVAEFFAATAPKLEQLKFEQTAVFTIDQATPNVTSHVALWINRAAGQAAAVNVMISRNGERPNQVKQYCEFLTRVQDGRSVTTNNSKDLGAFKKTADSDSLSAQHVPDVAHLYRLHLWREGQIAGVSTPRVLPAPGTEMPWFADMFEESIKRQLDTGYLMFAGDGVYLPTMQGAYMMTWGQLPPMNAIRRAVEDKRAEAQIRQASSIPFTPPANVKVVVLDAPPGDGGQTPPMRKVA
jgi:hypothetical protein